MAKKTNAMRLLDKEGLTYQVIEYQVDENNLEASHVAAKIGLPPAQVFKTLALRGDKTGILVAVIPGDRELDLKLVAKVSGNKSVSMLPLQEVLPSTGYIRGGVSPLGMKKTYPTYVEENALKFDKIAISAGLRGYQMFLAPGDLAKALRIDKFSKLTI